MAEAPNTKVSIKRSCVMQIIIDNKLLRLLHNCSKLTINFYSQQIKANSHSNICSGNGNKQNTFAVS